MCKKHAIPIPSNGYWQKVKFNKPVLRQKYRPAENDNESICLSLRSEGSSTTDKSPLITLTNTIKADTKAPLEVSKTLQNADPLIEQTKEYWDSKIKEGYRNHEKINILNIRTEPDNRQRALRLMNGLIKLLQYRGHHVRVTQSETFAVVHGVDIILSLREATKRIPPPTDKPYLTGDYVPVGELILKVGKWSREKEWRDGKAKLETLLARFVAWLELYAAAELESLERRRLWHIEYEEKKRLEEQEKQRTELEAQNVRKLLDDADRYTKTEQLRNYIEARRIKNASDNSPEFQSWLSWALEKADLLDPLSGEL